MVKLSSSLGEAQGAIAALPQLYQESLNAGMDSSFPDFSCILRGLAQSFVPETNDMKRVSLLFFEPPELHKDSDIHGALNSLLVADICCDFVYFSREEADESAAQRLGELALLVSSYSTVSSLERVREQHASLDLARLRSSWHCWAHPPLAATLRLPDHSLLELRLVQLLSHAPAPAQSSVCACHNLLVSRPARCCVTGRKPTERPVLAYTIDNMQFKAADGGLAAEVHELAVLAAMPASGIDACYVIGSPTQIAPASPAAEDFLIALADQMRSRGESLIVKIKSRCASTMHIASVTEQTGTDIVLVRVAAREDILMATTNEEHNPSPMAARASSELLDALPRPSTYNPLAYSNNMVAHFQKAVMAEQTQMAAATATAATAAAPQNPSALSRKMVKLNLQ